MDDKIEGIENNRFWVKNLSFIPKKKLAERVGFNSKVNEIISRRS